MNIIHQPRYLGRKNKQRPQHRPMNKDSVDLSCVNDTTWCVKIRVKK
jgi:hypothetical protein